VAPSSRRVSCGSVDGLDAVLARRDATAGRLTAAESAADGM